jgi:starch synthase
MKILLAASEVVGYAKTGGLADVAGSLPRALAERGHECAIFLPLYRSARNGPIPVEPTSITFNLPIGTKAVPGRLWRSRLSRSNVPVYLVEQPGYFERDDPSTGRGLYQYTLPNGQKRDYPDNCERYVFFCRAVFEAVRLLGWRPDVIHANDWQTGLIPVYLREEYKRLPEFEANRSLFTIHNIAYQGLFWHWDMNLTGLDWRLFNYRQLEFFGHLNLLKAGIVFADAIGTVSPTYAREIQTPYYGCGLQGVLAERAHQLFGIVNGADYDAWDPATDAHLSANYNLETVDQGKPLCKRALQRHFGLPEEAKTPILGMVARLVEQKGIELLARAAALLLAEGAQLIVLGEGDPKYHRVMQDLRRQYPSQIGLTIGFDEALAHQIEAGADVFLMPSLYEPSGLNQLYSMKYGTPPIVRVTGGLADTVVDCTPATLAAGTATGFAFLARAPEALIDAVRRALHLYRDEPEQWRRLVGIAMRQDWSWQRVATEYEKVYSALIRGDFAMNDGSQNPADVLP